MPHTRKPPTTSWRSPRTPADQVNTYTDWSWFTEQVISDVLEDLKSEKGYTEEEAYDLLYNSGLRVYTTCDVQMQNYLESAFNVDTNSTIFPAGGQREVPRRRFCGTGTGWPDQGH